METMNNKPQTIGKASSKKTKKWLTKLNKDNGHNVNKTKGVDTPLLQRDRTQQQLVKEAMKRRAEEAMKERAATSTHKKNNFKTILKKTFGTGEKSNKKIRTSTCSNSLGSPSNSIDSFLTHSSITSASPRSIVPLEVKTPTDTRVHRSYTVNTPKRTPSAMVRDLVGEIYDEEASVMTTPTNIVRKRLSCRRSQSFEVIPFPSLKKTTEEPKNEGEELITELTKTKVSTNFKRYRTYVNVKPKVPPKLIKSNKPSQSATEVRQLPIVRSVTMKTFKSETLKPTYSSNVNLSSNWQVTSNDGIEKTSTSSLLQEELQQVKKERKVTKITAKFEGSVKQKPTKFMNSVASLSESEEYVDLLKMAPLRERNNPIPKMVIKKASVVSRLQKPKMPTPPPPRARRPCMVIARPISVTSS